MSTYVSNRNGGGQTDEQGHYRFQTKVWQGNVLAGLKVKQNSPLARNVLVPAGDLKIDYGEYAYTAWNDADVTVSISTADTSNPRLDRIVAFVDRSLTSGGTNNVGYLKFIAVAGTPGATPSKASDVAVQAAVTAAAGAVASPWVELAVVRVEANATTIPDSKITDTRVMLYLPSTIMPDLRQQQSDLVFDHVNSGCVWSGDAYGSTRNASMTAGIVYINGRRITIGSVAARTFTASRDTYVDVIDNLDGTGSLVYTEVTNNNTSPALAANSIRIAIICTGASNIPSAVYVNQGQETAQWPQSNGNTVYVMVTDTIGNLICSRDPARKLLGYRQAANTFTTGSTAPVQITGIYAPTKIPTGRKVKVTIGAAFLYNGTNASRANLSAFENTTGGQQLIEAHGVNANGSSAQNGFGERTYTPTSNTITYIGCLAANPGGTANAESYSYFPSYIKIELE